VELRKDVPAFHNNLGMALEHTGRFAAAATAYSGALTADPGYGKAKQNLARVEVIKGDREEPFGVGETATPAVADTEISSDEAAAGR
jgi:Flp pilus assembly protein TadD